MNGLRGDKITDSLEVMNVVEQCLVFGKGFGEEWVDEM